MEINVPSICGEDLISRESGKKIRSLLLDHWSESKIILDFEDKLIGSVSFFDEALALLLKKGGKSIQEIQDKIGFKNLKKEDRDLLNFVIAARVKELESNSETKKK